MDKSKLKDQKNYLRKLLPYFAGIEKPIANVPRAESLQDLITKLHNVFSTVFVDVNLVNNLLLSYKSNAHDWETYAKWNRSRYTRNLVSTGNGKFNLLIICWPPDLGSAIHDHSDSHCFMKILQGELRETKYQRRQNISSETCFDAKYEEEKLEAIETIALGTGQVTYINDNIGYHRVENCSHANGAVSLHLYCPPFEMCSVFPSGSAKKVMCPVTFYSKFGVRLG